MKRLVLIFVCTSALAQTPTPPTLEELSVAYQICTSHMLPPGPPVPPRPNNYANGWEHCNSIELAYKTAKAAALARDKDTNPDLKTTLGIAEKLGVSPQ